MFPKSQHVSRQNKITEHLSKLNVIIVRVIYIYIIHIIYIFNEKEIHINGFLFYWRAIFFSLIFFRPTIHKIAVTEPMLNSINSINSSFYIGKHIINVFLYFKSSDLWHYVLACGNQHSGITYRLHNQRRNSPKTYGRIYCLHIKSTSWKYGQRFFTQIVRNGNLTLTKLM
jgi:hypothetical protein